MVPHTPALSLSLVSVVQGKFLKQAVVAEVALPRALHVQGTGTAIWAVHSDQA